MLALLSGANPRTSKGGPVVRLLAGSWELLIDGLIDTQLFICEQSQGLATRRTANHGLLINCLDVTEVKIEFGERGNEKYITVNAKRIA